MNQRIRRVIEELGIRSSYETKNESAVPYNERMLAISSNIGSFYNILLRSMKAKRVLEIGTSVGYSTLWFADAVLANGGDKSAIVTIEKDYRKYRLARANFKKAGISRLVDMVQGDALTVLDRLGTRARFDFIFIDADKENYVRYFDYCLKMVKKGGIIAADNIILPKKYRPIMKRYVRHVQSCRNVISVTVPLDYGEEISLRIR